MIFVSSPSSALAGEIKVPGDKSISHRSIILGSIADGVTIVEDILEGEDVLATIGAFREMGVNIVRSGVEKTDNHYQVQGVGMYGLAKPRQPLDMGNSGTAFRLLAGLLSAQGWSSSLDGDESLRARPMGRIVDPLTQMGAIISSCDGKPPLNITPGAGLKGIDYHTPMASAQVKSAVLLAGLYADGTTVVRESAPTRDHTERMLSGFGYAVDISENSVRLTGGGQLKGQKIRVPSDLSSAAFFILAGLICKDSELRLVQVGMNPSRNGVIEILKRMGGSLELQNECIVSGEPVADILVKSSSLKGISLGGDDIALSIDEIPVIAIAAAMADGVTSISGAEELRYKESDRIASVVSGLKALNVNVRELQDGMVIQGGVMTGGKVDSCGDHRIAMAFSIAGAAAQGEVEILDCANVATSFPNFREIAAQIGVKIALK